MGIDWIGAWLLFALLGAVVMTIASVVVSTRWTSLNKMHKAYLIVMCVCALIGFMAVLPFFNIFGRL